MDKLNLELKMEMKMEFSKKYITEMIVFLHK